MEDGSNIWASASTWEIGKKSLLPVSRLQTDSPLAIIAIWGMDQWIEDLSLFLSLPPPHSALQINNSLKMFYLGPAQ